MEVSLEWGFDLSILEVVLLTRFESSTHLSVTLEKRMVAFLDLNF